ncbi:MAG: hypothetical protein NTY53_05065 [Kiritimatiellaeota bacterium]|nr:hypothetical protein [Kiritimatiellota bacterium]
MSIPAYIIAFDTKTAPLQELRAQVLTLGSALKGAFEAGGALAIVAKLREGITEGLRYNSKLEEIQRSLAAVTGSAARASLRVDELNRMEGESRFDVNELAQVSRQLQIMTDGALAAGAGLRLVTDVASGTNTPLAATADALGRVYGQIQAGDAELGRGLQQLVMMGAINATTKNSIDALAKSGASAQQIWGALAASLGQFAGQGKASTQTMQGALDQLKKAFEEAYGAGTRNLFSQLQPMMAALTQSLRSNGAREAILALSGSMGQMIGQVLHIATALATCAPVWTAVTLGIKAFAAVKLAHLIGDFTQWVSKSWAGVAATTASTAAITAETRALLENSAAKRVSNLADRFAPARLPGKDSLLRDPVTGRFQKADKAGGTMRFTAYTQDTLKQTLEAQAAAAAPAIGSRIKGAIKFGVSNAGSIISAAFIGWELGAALGKPLATWHGKKSSGWATDEQFASGEDTRVTDAKLRKGVIEEIAGLDSVAKKRELIKQIEERIADIRERLGSDSTSAYEKEILGQNLGGWKAALHAAKHTSDDDVAGREARKKFDANTALNKPVADAAAKREQQKEEEGRFEEALAGAENYAEKLRLIQGELQKTTHAIADMGDVQSQTGNEGYTETLAQYENLQDKRRALERQAAEVGRESKKEGTEKSTRLEEYQLELKILNLRNTGNEDGALAAEKELAIRKKTAELLPLMSGGTADERQAAATAGAKQFVEADLLSRRPQPSAAALTPQTNNFERAGLFVGGVTNAIQAKATDAVVKSREILAQMYAFMKENKSAAGATWGAA